MFGRIFQKDFLSDGGVRSVVFQRIEMVTGEWEEEQKFFVLVIWLLHYIPSTRSILYLRYKSFLIELSQCVWAKQSGLSETCHAKFAPFYKKKKKRPKPTNQKPTPIPPPLKQTKPGWILGFGSFLPPSFLSSHRGLRLCIPRLCLSCVTSLVSNRLIIIKKMIWIMKEDRVMPRGFHACILLPLIIGYYLNCRDGQSCGSYMKEYNVFFCLPWIFLVCLVVSPCVCLALENISLSVSIAYFFIKCLFLPHFIKITWSPHYRIISFKG